jgi:hypothetical protein
MPLLELPRILLGGKTRLHLPEAAQRPGSMPKMIQPFFTYRGCERFRFWLFGYPVPPNVATANLGGTTLLWGNITPMFVKDGGYQEVKQAA